MGQIIAGRYELHDMLARGGMGSVWVSRDLRDGQVVAVKLLHQVEAVDLLRFVREAGLRMDHPHIAAPTGWVAEDDRVAFAMPLVRGGSAADLVRGRGPLPAPFVAEVLRQLLTALDHVHAQGWVHRDVKPGNLLLDPVAADERPRVRLTDFGIAVALDEPRLTHRVDSGEVGTPGYMPPERSGEPDPGADLYAAGITGLVLLTGTRPRELGHATLDVPDALREVLRRLTDADPSRRYATAREALGALQAPDLAWPTGGAGVLVPDLVEQVQAGRPPAPAAPPTRRARPRLGWIAAGVAVVLAIGAGAAVAVQVLGDDDPVETTSVGTSTAAEPVEPVQPVKTLTKGWAKPRVTVGTACAVSDKDLRAVTESGGVAQCSVAGEQATWQRATSGPVAANAVLTDAPKEPTWSTVAQRGGEPCDEVGEYAIWAGRGELLRCNGSLWTPEVEYPTGDGKGRGNPALYLPTWVQERVPFGTQCLTQGSLMITKGGYPARCLARKDELVWAYAPKEMPVHWAAKASTPPKVPPSPAWAPERVKRNATCSRPGQYAIEGGGWLVRCKDKTWALERNYPAPPGSKTADEPNKG